MIGAGNMGSAIGGLIAGGEKIGWNAGLAVVR
jgi:hypothetical protein